MDRMCKQFTDEEIKMANNHKNMFQLTNNLRSASENI